MKAINSRSFTNDHYNIPITVHASSNSKSQIDYNRFKPDFDDSNDYISQNYTRYEYESHKSDGSSNSSGNSFSNHAPKSNLSFMQTLLTEDDDRQTSVTGYSSSEANSSYQRPKTSNAIVSRNSNLSSKSVPIRKYRANEHNERVDIVVLLNNEKSIDKIDALTKKEYDLTEFRRLYDTQKISVITPKIHYLDIDYDQVEKAKKKVFDYDLENENSIFVDPFYKSVDSRPRAKPKRPKKANKKFKCVSYANPRNTLKNIDRTKAISEQLKVIEAISEEDLTKITKMDELKLSKDELLKSAQRLSRIPKTVKHDCCSNQYHHHRPKRSMDPNELEKSALRLSRQPKKKKEIEKFKTLHDGKVLTDAEIERISLRLYSSRIRKNNQYQQNDQNQHLKQQTQKNSQNILKSNQQDAKKTQQNELTQNKTPNKSVSNVLDNINPILPTLNSKKVENESELPKKRIETSDFSSDSDNTKKNNSNSNILQSFAWKGYN